MAIPSPKFFQPRRRRRSEQPGAKSSGSRYNPDATTTITILPEKPDGYRAPAGDKESTGRTAGEALDALTSQLEEEERGTLVIVQNRKADEFLSAGQQERLTELTRRRRTTVLSAEEE
jgi:hypothetical protein